MRPGRDDPLGQAEGRRGSAAKVWDKREFKDFAGDETLGPRNIRIALRRLGAPADIAHAVLFLASEHAAWITGQVLSVNGGA